MLPESALPALHPVTQSAMYANSTRIISTAYANPSRRFLQSTDLQGNAGEAGLIRRSGSGKEGDGTRTTTTKSNNFIFIIFIWINLLFAPRAFMLIIFLFPRYIYIHTYIFIIYTNGSGSLFTPFFLFLILTFTLRESPACNSHLHATILLCDNIYMIILTNQI